MKPSQLHIPVNSRVERQLTDRNKHIKYEVAEDNPGVPPAVVKADVERDEELIADLVLAVLARGRRVRVVEVPTKRVDELAGPLLACLPARWVEGCELVGFADDLEATISRVKSDSVL